MKKKEEKKVDLDIKNCPFCGKKVIRGFGLAGGGYGPYIYCQDDKCEFFYKEQEKLKK